MRAVILLSTICLTGFATAAVAQRPAASSKPKPAAAAGAQAAASAKPTIAGAWAMESNVKTAAGKDTVVRSLVTATADANGWVTHLAGRAPIATRVVAMGGDSVVTEAGPFQSVTRPGQTVTTRETLHFKDNAVWGAIEARFSNGEVVKGTVKGTRKK
ncbi:MAG: hypothetical protein DMD66_00815 [Gemmatimonadetes bacterium]|nr:MAG: hypothetical protein DMD66_00815 [Gemmatimonadota bacterium]